MHGTKLDSNPRLRRNGAWPPVRTGTHPTSHNRPPRQQLLEENRSEGHRAATAQRRRESTAVSHSDRANVVGISIIARRICDPRFCRAALGDLGAVRLRRITLNAAPLTRFTQRLQRRRRQVQQRQRLSMASFYAQQESLDAREGLFRRVQPGLFAGGGARLARGRTTSCGRGCSPTGRRCCDNRWSGAAAGFELPPFSIYSRPALVFFGTAWSVGHERDEAEACRLVLHLARH